MRMHSRHFGSPIDRSHLEHQTVTGFILDFEGPPPQPSDFSALTLHRATTLPALNRLLPAPPGQPRHWWGSRLDAAVHIRHRAVLPACEDLHAATNEVIFRPLPSYPSPPWDIWMLSVPDGNRFRLCYRISHAIQDGVGAAHTVLALLGNAETAGPYSQRPSVPTPRGTLRVVREFLQAPRQERDWPSLLATPLGHLTWVYQDVPATLARTVADNCGATVNDVCLAALAQAFRQHHSDSAQGALSTIDVPALVPMSTRSAQQRHAPGNHSVSHRLLLPCSAERLAEAIRRVSRQTAAVRKTRQRDASRLALIPLTPRLGDWVIDRMTVTRAAPVVASSVTFPRTVTCAGARLTGASMFCDPYNKRLAYISFTRTTDVIRCTAVYDSAFSRAAAIPSGWKTSLTAGP